MSNSKKIHIVFTGGGSGGHVFPGLAILRPLLQSLSTEIINKDIQSVWIGSHQGPEKKYIPDGISFYGITTGKFRRYFSLKNIIDPFNIVRGILQAYRKLRKLQPLLVVSIGGYVSVPTVLAARLCKIPVVSMICDISLGLATKLNIPHSQLILCAYKETKQYILENSRYVSLLKKQLAKLSHYSVIEEMIECVGLPIREELVQGNSVHLNKIWNIEQSAKVVVFVGGSKGAHQINELVLELLPKFSNDVVIIHQYGNMEHILEEMYTCKYIPVDFISEEYAHVLSRANVIISRAGSGALWEIVANTIPAIIIPLSSASSRGDQLENVRYFEERDLLINAGVQPTGEELYKIITGLLQDQSLREHYIQNCKNFDACNASKRAVSSIISLIKNY